MCQLELVLLHSTQCLCYDVQEVAVCSMSERQRSPARQDEWTLLRHQDEEDGKASCGPLLPTGPHHGRSGSDGDREDSQEQQTVEKRKRKLLDLHPQNAVDSIWMNDVMAYTTMTYAITAYTTMAYARNY